MIRNIAGDGEVVSADYRSGSSDWSAMNKVDFRGADWFIFGPPSGAITVR